MDSVTYRSHAKPSLALPLNVRSVGHYVRGPGKVYTRGAADFLQLFWCSAGSGEFHLGKGTRPLQPGTVLFYFSGEDHRITAGSAGIDFRWVTLDSPFAPDLLRAFGLERSQEVGKCPSGKFQRLTACLRDVSIEGELMASALAYEILLQAVSRSGGGRLPKPQEQILREARSRLDERFQDSRMDVGRLADELGIHRSTLYRGFCRLFGVSPVQYLGRQRISHALRLLKETSLPVADIAVQCGITDISYFSRLVREATGRGPRELRKFG